MHVFVYHVEYWFKHHESLEIFSNFVVEAMHRRIKRRNITWKNKYLICKRWLQMDHWERCHCPHSNEESENLRNRIRWTEETIEQRQGRKKKTQERREKMKKKIDQEYENEEYYPSDYTDSDGSSFDEDEEEEEEEEEDENEEGEEEIENENEDENEDEDEDEDEE
jgi:hypothetical protein